MNKEPYSFCFLRYFHDPLSGEFANVGVLLWAPDRKSLLFRGTERFSRLSHFFADFHSEDYRKMMKRIQTRFDEFSAEIQESSPALLFHEVPESARDFGEKVIPLDSAALQWSRSGGGLSESPEAEVEALYAEHIERHYLQPAGQRRDEASVFRASYRAAFSQPEVRSHIKPKKIEAPLTAREFEHSWLNGRWNVYETLSFDMMQADAIRMKAKRWRSESELLAQSDEEHRLHFLLGAPQGRHEKAYSDARKILTLDRDVTLIEEDEAEEFAEELKSQILKAQ